MANEAYRAVFLRVHPTGKMVLSLTTESDGKEAEYARLVADELGVPALDVKVVPADTDRFGVGHGYNTSPSEGTSAAIVGATEKIRAKGQLLAGMALETSPESLKWFNGAWGNADGDDPTQVKTVEEIALYAHGTGELPPGVEGGLDAQTVYADCQGFRTRRPNRSRRSSPGCRRTRRCRRRGRSGSRGSRRARRRRARPAASRSRSGSCSGHRRGS